MNEDTSQPDLDDTSRPFWESLQAGRLTFQNCENCGNNWLPPRAECPRCLSPASGWKVASGKAKLVSWVVYHQAMHPAFASRVPYTVAVVELVEGPRMLTNIVGPRDPETLRLDELLQLTLEQEGDFTIPRFTPVDRDVA